MTLWQGKSKRKKTGGRYHSLRDKKRREMGGQPLHTTMGEKQLKKISGRGSTQKLKLAKTSYANVLDPKTKKYKKAKIKSVATNTANRHFVRMGVITKGAVIETDAGNARVTSRPSQDGTVNAILEK
ncbi:MAG: 30S ribosomal protein S8e [Nanoarchaeota archaeon]|nr:30S ribosomal protein S8e [Nanoarchaeota archaeon]